MTNVERRLAMLTGRTTREAWLRLQRMQHRPEFEALLTDLERLDGTVTESDVSRAVQRLVDRQD